MVNGKIETNQLRSALKEIQNMHISIDQKHHLDLANVKTNIGHGTVFRHKALSVYTRLLRTICRGLVCPCVCVLQESTAT